MEVSGVDKECGAGMTEGGSEGFDQTVGEAGKVTRRCHPKRTYIWRGPVRGIVQGLLSLESFPILIACEDCSMKAFQFKYA